MQSIVVYYLFNFCELIQILLMNFEIINDFACPYYKKSKKNK
jgi:hypothetical protein